MKKYFNIAGPCNETKHYMIPVIQRNHEILKLIEQEQYFVIHAARQTGKTTTIQHFVNYLNSQNKFYALYCSLESVQTFGEPEKGIFEIFNNLKFAITFSDLPQKENFGKDLNLYETTVLIKSALVSYCKLLDKPLVIFIDEIDCLQNETLITFLRQIRDGFITRNTIPFMQSVALVGMRNIRDYKSKIRDTHQTLGSASPFNIITKALTIRNFSISDIETLYSKHTQSTGQVFERAAIDKIVEQTDGQPWLVNAIAREIIEEILGNDYTKPITAELVEEAIQIIILRRDTHIDSLLDKLKDMRVRRIIEPIILGKSNSISISNDDTQYCLDLGLIKIVNGEILPANKIYNEVIIRTLSSDTQFELIQKIKPEWVDVNGKLNMTGLLIGFQQFWRENADIWVEKYEYKEAAPHLILQAFLQRVINGGGTILREYASGRERMDLCVIYGDNKYTIELKIRYSKSVVREGIEQLANYMRTIGEEIGWLVIFDRNSAKNWDEKIFWEIENYEGKTIHVVGC